MTITKCVAHEPIILLGVVASLYYYTVSNFGIVWLAVGLLS